MRKRAAVLCKRDNTRVQWSAYHSDSEVLLFLYLVVLYCFTLLGNICIAFIFYNYGVQKTGHVSQSLIKKKSTHERGVYFTSLLLLELSHLLFRNDQKYHPDGTIFIAIIQGGFYIWFPPYMGMHSIARCEIALNAILLHSDIFFTKMRITSAQINIFG